MVETPENRKFSKGFANSPSAKKLLGGRRRRPSGPKCAPETAAPLKGAAHPQNPAGALGAKKPASQDLKEKIPK